MIGIEREGYMEQSEAISGYSRRVTDFVPEGSIRAPEQIPDAILRSHLATSAELRSQGGGTSVEGHLFGRFGKRETVETEGQVGLGVINLLKYKLDEIERGAGEYVVPMIKKVTRDPYIRFSGGVQGELEKVTAELLNERAGVIAHDFRLGMTEEALERRAAMYEHLRSPREAYEVDPITRRERMHLPPDFRSPIITVDEINRILHDLASEGKQRLVQGYYVLENLFTGNLKGPQERLYLDSVSKQSKRNF